MPLCGCTTMVTSGFKVVLDVVYEARDTKVNICRETKLKGADLTWSNLANNYEEREKQKE